jgi:RNA polymerase sigma factor (sigma-70 family)
MPALLPRSRTADADLARRLAAGDDGAFATLDARYRRALVRYARSLLRRSEHDAEDVVQDVLIRAHAILRDGDGPEELRPWLYRLVRNRAIDEVRRARWGDAALDDDDALVAGEREDPEAVLRRRETLRRLVDDLADLPVRQRTALLARELDDQTPEQVAAQLKVSVPAAQMLATRARENLIKARAAHDADHADIRAALLDAHERGVRPAEHVLRHVKECDSCRAYQRELRRLTKQLHGLHPAFALPLVGGAAKLLSGGGAKAAIAAGAAAVVIAATGGVLVLEHDTVQSGEAAPFTLKGVKPLVGRSVSTGGSVPSGTALVTARVRVPAGAPAKGERRSVTLACPEPMRVTGLQAPEQDFPLSYGLSKGTVLHFSRRARIDFGRAILPRSYDVTVGVLCRRPGASGSLADNPRLAGKGEQAGRVCVSSDYLYLEPGRLVVGTVFRDQPLAIRRRSASGRWVRVVSDIHSTGWLRASSLCR